MSRRTVLWAAVVALAGCHGPNASMNSTFKMPTPSFNLLAPYGPPRVPPPGTHSYGQPTAMAPSAASNTQPYYPNSNGVRGVSLPQSPEGGDAPTPSATPAGKVATAVWRSARSPVPGADEEATSATLASHQAIAETVQSPSGEPPILIPERAVEPAETPPLLLGGMRAHDLTKAVANEPAPVAMATPVAPVIVASTVAAAPAATQVIYSAPVSAPVATPAPASTSTGLIEMTDLSQGASNTNRSLQRVRGFEEPPVAAAISEPAPASFIEPKVTISASTAQETRDAVAAAALESEPAIIKPAAAPAASGWKSRYSTDES